MNSSICTPSGNSVGIGFAIPINRARRVAEDLIAHGTVPLLVQRGRGTFQTEVRVTDLPEVTAPRVTVLREIQLVTLPPAIRVERGLHSGRGAYVQSVSQRVAEMTRLQPGDVIIQVNRTHIISAKDAAQALNGERGVVVMYVEQQRQHCSTEFAMQ